MTTILRIEFDRDTDQLTVLSVDEWGDEHTLFSAGANAVDARRLGPEIGEALAEWATGADE